MAFIWKKKKYFDLLFTFLVTREKTQKFLQHISHIQTRILLTLLTFFALIILQKLLIYLTWFLFGVRLLVLILFRVILEQSLNNKMVSKI